MNNPIPEAAINRPDIKELDVIKVQENNYWNKYLILYVNPESPSVARVIKYDSFNDTISNPTIKYLVNMKVEVVKDSKLCQHIIEKCKNSYPSEKAFIEQSTADFTKETKSVSNDIIDEKGKEESSVIENVKTSKSWSPEEDEYLRTNLGKKELSEICENLDRTKKSVQARAFKLKLSTAGPDAKKNNKPKANHPWNNHFAADSQKSNEQNVKHFCHSELGNVPYGSNQSAISIIADDQWKIRWDRVKEIVSAIRKYNNKIPANEFLDYMNKLEVDCNYDPTIER